MTSPDIAPGYGDGETLAGEITASTEAAVLFENSEDGSEFWIPRSVCLDGEGLEVGDTDVVVARWWLKRGRRGPPKPRKGT